MADDALRSGLISNALDFLRQSINDIEKQPKYSVIHFCSAVELLLKARLMSEHWTQILKRPDEADLKKFRDGDFVSISIEDAIVRLKKVVNDELPPDTARILDALRKHRNQLIHFFDKAYLGTADKTVTEKVVSEQCTAWFHIHSLLVGRWKPSFEDHLEDIGSANKAMHRLRVFLKAKFLALRAEIAAAKSSGGKILKCPSCGFKACVERDVLPPLKEGTCLVCQNRRHYLRVQCPHCEENIVLDDPDEHRCSACGKEISVGDLISEYAELGRLKDEAADPSTAKCMSCLHTEESTVARVGGDWLCFRCFAVWDRIDSCEFCGERWAGELEDSYNSGCELCDGAIEWNSDDD